MDTKRRYRLRIQNCICTIIDVHNLIRDEYENWDFLSQFENLEDNIQDLDLDHISETEVLMVEQATNDLLVQFSSVFEAEELGPVYGFPDN